MLLLSLQTLVHLNQLSVILLCSSFQLGNICIPITDRLTYFLIKFVLLIAPLSRKKKSTSRVSPPRNLPLTRYMVFISCIGNGKPQFAIKEPRFLNVHGNFWNDMIAWLFSIGLEFSLPVSNARREFESHSTEERMLSHP